MRNEKNIIKGEGISTSCLTLNQSSESGISQDLPICSSCEDIERSVPKNEGENFAFNASEVVIHEYVKKIFYDRNVYDFMELYFMLHYNKSYIIPIASSQVTCILRKASNVEQLTNGFKEQQQSADNEFALKLHNSEYVLTLIECSFDISDLKFQSDDYCFYMTEHYRFQIKSSSNSNLTIIYEKIG
jgi:hypothetical protein